MTVPVDSGGGLGDRTPKRKKRRKSPTHVPTPAPQTDVQSSGGDYGTRKAERHKKTRAYRGAVRAGYDANPPEERARRASRAKGGTSPEDRAIEHAHRARERQHELDRAKAQHDAIDNGDIETANEFTRVMRERAQRDDKNDLTSDLAVAEAFKHTPDYLRLKAEAAKKGYERADEEGKKKLFGDPEKDTEKPEVLKGFKEAEAAGVNPTDDSLSKAFGKLVGTSASVAGTTLEQLARPGHAVNAALREDVETIKEKGLGHYLLHGSDKSLHAAGQGIQNKDKATFSDVLGEAGYNPKSTGGKILKGVAGFTGDVVTDPLNLVTGGVASPARRAAAEAFEGAIRAGKTQEEALKLARAAYDANPAKAKGPTIGVRVRVPFTHAQAHAQTSGRVSSRIVGVTKAAGRAVTRKPSLEGEAAPGKFSDFVQRFKHEVAPNARHHDIHPVDEDFVRHAATEGRVRRAELERDALNRAHAYAEYIRKNGITPEQQHEMALAIDAGDLDRLRSPELRKLAETIQHDLKDAGDREVALQVRSMLIGEREAPVVPAILAEPDVAKEALIQARRARGKAERDLREVLRLEGTAQGRAEILSRNVGNVKGEREAEKTARALDRMEKKAGKTGSPQDVLRQMDEMERLSANGYRGGAHGARGAREARIDAEHAVTEAKAAEKEAQSTFDKVMAQHKAETAANRQGLEDLAQYEREAKSYYPRRMRDDTREDRSVAPASGESVSGKSLKHRKVSDRLELLDEGKQAQYLTDDAPRAVGLRLLEHANMAATAETLNRLGALGEHVRHLDDLPDLSADTLGRLMVKTPRGYTPLVRQKGFVPEGGEVGAAIARAVENGADLRLIPKREFDLAFDLMNRGRGKVGDLPIEHLFDRTQGALKTALTMINPGFHGTNLVGDTFNFRAGGGRMTSLPRALQLLGRERSMTRAERDLERDGEHGVGAQINKILRRGGKRERYGDLELNDSELVELARQHGAIQRGMAGHELREVRGGDELERQGRRFRPLEGIRSLNEQREDFVRLASFHSAMKRGLDPESAARWVNEHHFDYGDLTMTERRYLRRAIPFYTFWSRNLPLQVKSVGRNPGMYANLELAREESYKQAGLDPDDYKKLPKYAQQGLPLMLPFRIEGLPVALYPKLPVTDLNTLDPRDLANQVMQRTTPLAKVLLETWTGYNFFFKDMHQDARVPAPSKLLGSPHSQADLDTINEVIEGVTSVPGFPGGKVTNAVKMIRDNKTGKMVPGWSWKLDLLLRQTPVMNTLSSMMTERTTNQNQTQRGLSALGYLLGPRPGLVDPVAIRQSQLFEEHDRLEKERRALTPTVKNHAPGEPWGGRIGKINKRIREIEQKIAKLDKKQGFKVPRFGATLPQGSGWGAAPRAGSAWDKVSSGGGGWK